jgi:hypothetical protein
MYSDLTTKVLYQQNVVIHNAVTTIEVLPELSLLNPARSLYIQNLGASSVYVTYDGEYDPDKRVLSKNTNPADGVGQLLQGTGIVCNLHLMRANPRMISPSGDQTVNVVITG